MRDFFGGVFLKELGRGHFVRPSLLKQVFLHFELLLVSLSQSPGQEVLPSLVLKLHVPLVQQQLLPSHIVTRLEDIQFRRKQNSFFLSNQRGFFQLAHRLLSLSIASSGGTSLG